MKNELTINANIEEILYETMLIFKDNPYSLKNGILTASDTKDMLNNLTSRDNVVVELENGNMMSLNFKSNISAYFVAAPAKDDSEKDTETK